MKYDWIDLEDEKPTYGELVEIYIPNEKAIQTKIMFAALMKYERGYRWVNEYPNYFSMINQKVKVTHWRRIRALPDGCTPRLYQEDKDKSPEVLFAEPVILVSSSKDNIGFISLMDSVLEKINNLEKDEEKDKKDEKQIGYICKYCARKMGGEWPDGHVATMHAGICSVCEEHRSLAHPNDWQLDNYGNRTKISAEEWD